MNEHLERNLIADKKTKPLCRCLALSASLPLQQPLPPWTVINDKPDVSMTVNPVPVSAQKGPKGPGRSQALFFSVHWDPYYIY